ncbi:MAG: T9SS type A sorting domain-containing protein [Bacteroidia bacterium]
MKKLSTQSNLSIFTSGIVRVSIIALILIGAMPISGYSQNSSKNQNGFKEKWKINPFDHKIFIENKGQFDADVKNENIDKVLYEAVLGGDIKAYFTPNGILYRQVKFVSKDKVVVNKVGVLWEGSNPNVTIEASGKQTYFESYGTLDNKTIKANVFKKIIYRNLYPGIDVEYIFPGEGKEGLKYTVIVHPGADLSVVKLKYSGVNILKIDETGNVQVENTMSKITDHTPVSSYLEGGIAHVDYAVNGQEESFSAKNHDKTKTLIIDPWSETNLGFISGNSGYDIDYDNYGNVYVAGGYNPFQISKFNSEGVKQWIINVFSTDNSNGGIDQTIWGDFVVDHHSGEVYAVEGYNANGAWAEKYTATGTKLATFNGTNEFRKMCRAKFNAQNGQVDIGGGGEDSFGSGANDQTAVLDTNMGSLSPANPLGATGPGHDVCLMALDPTGPQAYFAVAQSSYSGQGGIDSNFGFSVPLPGLNPAFFMFPTGYNFQADSSITYVGAGIGDANGMNGMAVSPNWLYMYDGKTLKQFNKSNGVLNNSVAVGSTSFTCGGLDADACDNVFVGNGSNIAVYNPSLKNIANIAVGGTVYAIALGGNDSVIYACGDGFVQEFSNTNSVVTVTASSTPTTCGLNNGSATVSLALTCATPGTVTYLWSPGGETTQTINNLAPGTYTVTMNIGGNVFYQATTTVDTTPKPLVSVSGMHDITAGSSDTLIASGACSYTWAPGGNTSDTIIVSPVATTTYSITGSCSGGCSSPIDTFTVHVNGTVGINNISNSNSISLYPNPSNGVFQLRIKNYELGINNTVEVYNVLGEKIASSNSSKGGEFYTPSGGEGWAINLSDKPAGIYFVKVMSDSEVQVFKLVIQK